MVTCRLLVVLVVVGVLVAIAAPGVIDWNRNERVKAMARAVGDAFSVARSEAIRTGNQFLVVVANGIGGAPSNGVVVIDDGAEAAANCSIDAGELLHRVDLDAEVAWGTTPGLAGVTGAPDDEGGSGGTIEDGWSFTQPGSATPASHVLFRSDGLPRLFAPGGNCASVGNPGGGGGAIYLTNGNRDYAVVLQPLGTVRLHRWDAQSAGWSP